ERPGLELEIEGAFEPVADTEALRKQKLERRFREQKWMVLRKAEQAGTSADQLPLTSDEYAVFVQAAYEAALRSGAVTNAIEAAPAPAPVGRARPSAEQK